MTEPMNNKSGSEPSHKYRDFMKLTLEERRRLMSESSEKYVAFEQAEKCYDSFPEFPFLNQVNRAECVEKIADAIQRSKAMLESAVVGAIQMIEGYDKSYDDLQKLCDHLRTENDSLYAYKTVRGSHLEIENERLEKLYDEQKDSMATLQLALDGANHAKNLLHAQVEEHKADIVALHGFYKAKCGHIMEANQSLCGSCQLESQLATQTERVRRLTEALEDIACKRPWKPHLRAGEALNQESLGDGKAA